MDDGGRPPFPETPGKAQQAYEHLRRSIAGGLWKVGERLPTERELAQRLGLARNTVRRALDVLEAEGLIARGVGRGTFLAQGGDLPEPLPLERFDDASPAQVMEVRILLEPVVAESACLRATPSDLASLEECAARCEGATSTGEFEHWDAAFHRTIVSACHNTLLDGLYSTVTGIRKRAEWGRLKERTLTPERRASYERDHRTITGALLARDGSAAREALRRHLLAVRDDLFTP